MGERGRGSAIGAVAAEAANQGTAAALTGGRGENTDGEALGDLFGALDAEVDGYAGATVAPPVKRGPGRPPGSPNRTTLQLQRYLQARGYRDPAEFLASIMSMDTRELAAALRGPVKPCQDCGEVPPVGFDEALAALEIQRKAASELMPYFHQRMPQQVEHRGEGARPLIIIADGAASGRIGAASDGAMSVLDYEDIQGLEVDRAASSDVKSHEARSHDVD